MLEDFAKWLWRIISDFFVWIIGLVSAFFGALWTFGTDLFLDIVEQFFKLLVYVLNAVSIPFEALQIDRFLSSIPVEIVDLMGLIGIDASMTMIVSAFLIRISLRLIPFVRGVVS